MNAAETFEKGAGAAAAVVADRMTHPGKKRAMLALVDDVGAALGRIFTGERGADSMRVLGLWQRALDAIGAGSLDAIVREIVQMHGGEGCMQSDEMRGTGFSIELPRTAARGRGSLSGH